MHRQKILQRRQLLSWQRRGANRDTLNASVIKIILQNQVKSMRLSLVRTTVRNLLPAESIK